LYAIDVNAGNGRNQAPIGIFPLLFQKEKSLN
jgi:hypothetical protein